MKLDFCLKVTSSFCSHAFLSWHPQSVRTLVTVVIIIKQRKKMHILMFYLCCQQHCHHCSSIFASLFLLALATVMRMMRKKPRVHTAATGSTTTNSTPETNVKFKENEGTAETCWCYRSSRHSVRINIETGAYWTEICLVLRSWWGHRWGDPERGLHSLLLSYWSSYNSEKEWCSWEKSKMRRR